MNLVPPDDRVLVRLLPAESHTAFGLELPEQARETSLRAIVLAVGRGYDHPTNPKVRISLGLHWRLTSRRIPERSTSQRALLPLREGDEVVLPRVGGTEIEAEDGETVISILAESILAVVA